MKICKSSLFTETWSQTMDRLEQPYKWFAWYPVCLNDGTIVWQQYVCVQSHYELYDDGMGGSGGWRHNYLSDIEGLPTLTMWNRYGHNLSLIVLFILLMMIFVPITLLIVIDESTRQHQKCIDP